MSISGLVDKILHSDHLSKSVYSLLIVAIILRLACWSNGLNEPERYLKPDSYDYLRLAQALLDNHHFGSQDQLEIFRPPGYPFILLCFKTMTSLLAIPTLFQVLLDGLLCCLLWYLAGQLYSWSLANVSLAFQSLSLVSAVYATQVLSDSIFTLFLFLFLIVFSRIVSSSRFENRTCLIGGILIALMAYLRAITLLYVFIPIAILIFSKRVKESLVIAAVLIVMLSPWYLRNYYHVGYPHFSSVGAINLYRYNACLLQARETGLAFNQQQSLIDSELDELTSQQSRADYAMSRGKAIILSQPLTYFWLHLRADLNNLLPVGGEFLKLFGYEIGGNGTISVLHSQGVLAAVKHYFNGNWSPFLLLVPTVILLLTSYLSALIGVAYRIFSKKFNTIDLLFLSTLLYFLLVPGGASHPRFRVPVTPILSIYAGVGLVFVYNALKSMIRGRRNSKCVV